MTKLRKAPRIRRVLGPPLALRLDEEISLEDISTDKNLCLRLWIDEEAPEYVLVELGVWGSGLPKAWRDEARVTGAKTPLRFSRTDILRALATKAAYSLTDKASILSEASSTYDNKAAVSDIRRMKEGRKIGQVLGARANKEKGASHENATIKLAKEVWAQRPQLKSNISATAREIAKKRDRALNIGGSFFLKEESIRKHLTRARRDGRV